MVNANSCSAILGTTRDETSTILVQTIDWLWALAKDDPGKPSEFQNLQTQLSSVLSPPNTTSHRFWMSLLKAIYGHKHIPYNTSPDYPPNCPSALTSFFVDAPEHSPELDDWKQTVTNFVNDNSSWWNSNGTPNGSRNVLRENSLPPSRSSSRSPSHQLDEQEMALDEAGQTGRDKGKGKEKDEGEVAKPAKDLKAKLDAQVARSLAKKLGPRPPSTDANAVASTSRVQIQGSGGGGGGGGDDDDDPFGGGGGRKPSRSPSKRARSPQEHVTDEEEEEDHSLEAVHGPVDESVRSAFLQGRKALLRINRSRMDPHLTATSSAMQEASAIPRKDVLFEVAQSGQNLPNEVALAVYYNNEPWDLEKVHEYDSGSTTTVGRLHEDLDGKALLETTKLAKKNKIRSGYQWLAAWNRCSIVAACLYPHRTDEFIKYSEYITSLVDGHPHHLDLVLQFDVAFRSKVGSPGHVTRLDDVRHEQQLLSQHLYANPQYLKSQLGGGARSASSGGGGGGGASPKKKSKKGSSNDPCKNWNNKKGSCSGNGDCQNGRKHVCDHDGCTQSHRSSDHHR